MVWVYFFIFATLFSLVIYTSALGADLPNFSEALLRGVLATLGTMILVCICVLMSFGMVHVFHTH